MNRLSIPSRRVSLTGLLSLAALAACGGGGGGGSGSAAQGGFQISDISVTEGAIWKINREMVFDFNQDVDFSTVNLNTISIRDQQGVPVSGEFTLKTSKRVVFQPTCPTKEDFSDAGLAPGGNPYVLQVFGEASGATLTVLSTAGKPVVNSQTRNFITPNSTDPAQIFFDPVVGPPSPVLHTPASAASDPGTYIELDDDADQRIYFVFDPLAPFGSQFSEPGSGDPSAVPVSLVQYVDGLPVNLYSSIQGALDQSTSVAVLLEINQPVNPSSVNISSDRLRLEFLDEGGGQWKKLSSTVELVQNCTQSGALLRIEPLGALPQGSQLRLVVTSAFQDLVGEANLLDINQFARFRTLVFDNPSLVPPDALADELLEEFVLGGSTVGSFEDTTAAFAEPKAIWKDGKLSAAFEFTGDGGFDGQFDWVIQAGQVINLSTTSAIIHGGDIDSDPPTAPFSETKSQTVIGGLVNVRHMRVDAGGTLKILGPNPVVIQATGQVIINGLIDVSGVNAKDVSTLDTGNQPEAGSPGVAGGGTGGTGNFLTTTSTPQGGAGFGAFNVPNSGGNGGESGFDPAASGIVNSRRPGGGGGGAFGADEVPVAPGGAGLAAMPGKDGSTAAKGAVTKVSPPKGGLPGPRPFFDATTTNDFFGTKFDTLTSTLTIGELPKPWAGSGGGAGGNACAGPSFPTPSWSPASDEKAAGGGGAGGSFLVRALDSIKFGLAGRIACNGGTGGSGENTNGTDHVGGGSGGASGGHVILQAGSKIDFTATLTTADIITARGGLFGKGSGTAETGVNAGGNGGPGIIQLHTLGGAADILLPGGQTLANKTAPNALVLIPTFGSRSRARSVWIPLGGAKLDPQGGFNAFEFLFGGIDTTTGFVLDLNADFVVDDVASVLTSVTSVSYPPLAPVPVVPFIGSDERTLVVDASPLFGSLNDIYVRNPALLRNFKLRLSQAAAPAVLKDFDVASATYDEVLERLVLVVSASGPKLTSFNPGAGAVFSLIPRFFRVLTSSVPDALPDTTSVQVTFQAATAAIDGSPDSANPLVDWTSDITDFNSVLPGSIDFFRFEVLFDLDAQDQGLSVSSPKPALDYLRIPFRF